MNTSEMKTLSEQVNRLLEAVKPGTPTAGRTAEPR